MMYARIRLGLWKNFVYKLEVLCSNNI